MINVTNESKQKLDNYYISLAPEKTYVLGEGNINSKIVFIGEAPGGEEEKQLKPFVGKAGKNLTSFLEMANCSRSDIYITNAVKFRPTKQNPNSNRLSNRTPTTAEILDAREWLLSELRLINPKLVVTLGNTPLFSVTNDKNVKISDVHGTIIDYKNNEFGLDFKLMPFYHPAAVIYRRELITEYENDMTKFAKIACDI